MEHSAKGRAGASALAPAAAAQAEWPFRSSRWRGLLAVGALAAGVALAAQLVGRAAGAERPVRDADRLLSQMTLAEKIGQMTQPDRRFLERDQDIRDLGLGSLLSGGGSTPPRNTPRDWADMCDRYQRQALASRLGIPLIYGVDAVHGHNNVVGAVLFPHNIALGCTRDPELLERAARITAREVAATGIHWTFSPCVAVPQDERWGRTYEGFSEDPALVRTLAAAAVRGYQGPRLGEPASILACAKHFIGDGGTFGGRDQGDTRLAEDQLRALHLPGYLGALEAGVGSIMVSFSSWNGVKMHAQQHLLTDVLKGELGFSGFLVSDWRAIEQLPGSYGDQLAIAINAGIDMVMVPDRYREFIATLTEQVRRGRVSPGRIDDAVRRILKAKIALGLFERPLARRELLAEVGSAEHRAVARQCVRESLVLLKNDGRLLPLRKDLPRLCVTGDKADDLGAQCGGWSVSWQGGEGQITEGTTLLDGIRQAVLPATRVAFFPSSAQADVSGTEVGIVVVGEGPYAESRGDRQDLSLSAGDVANVLRLKQKGLRVVVIVLSGRPLLLEPIWAQADAILAAWLPGTEGAGVADVVFGDSAPRGKLSVSWPRTMAQIPINVGDVPYDPLLPYGFGLGY